MVGEGNQTVTRLEANRSHTRLQVERPDKPYILGSTKHSSRQPVHMSCTQKR